MFEMSGFYYSYQLFECWLTLSTRPDFYNSFLNPLVNFNPIKLYYSSFRMNTVSPALTLIRVLAKALPYTTLSDVWPCV